MSIIQKIALVFTILGAINWALIGIFSFNLVEFFFNEGTVPTRIVYILIGLTGLFNIALLFLPNRHRVKEEF
ncbi:MAG: DUF378 domain-containing protein [Acholeplasmatales bacterium]|nr:DUF378 domain-containing protein [Acholeplasmatales bacterium]